MELSTVDPKKYKEREIKELFVSHYKSKDIEIYSEYPCERYRCDILYITDSINIFEINKTFKNEDSSVGQLQRYLAIIDKNMSYMIKARTVNGIKGTIFINELHKDRYNIDKFKWAINGSKYKIRVYRLDSNGEETFLIVDESNLLEKDRRQTDIDSSW